jgi:nitrogen fixation NifU-like protein
MNELRDLYQDVIIEHGRRPRNFGNIEQPDCFACGKNPLCGDQITVYMQIKDDRITDVKFDGEGCAICLASASLMSEHLTNRDVKEAERLFNTFHRLITEDNFAVEDDSLGKLVILSGVKEYPARVKCATLAWHTLLHALQKQDSVATTE